VILLEHKAKPSGLSLAINLASPKHRGTAIFVLHCCKWICMEALVWNNWQTHKHIDLSWVVFCLQRSFPEGDGGSETPLLCVYIFLCVARFRR